MYIDESYECDCVTYDVGFQDQYISQFLKEKYISRTPIIDENLFCKKVSNT